MMRVIVTGASGWLARTFVEVASCELPDVECAVPFCRAKGAALEGAAPLCLLREVRYAYM